MTYISCAQSMAKMYPSPWQLAPADGQEEEKEEEGCWKRVGEQREREMERQSLFGREWGSQCADKVCVLSKQQNTQKGKMGYSPVQQKCRQH